MSEDPDGMLPMRLSVFERILKKHGTGGTITHVLEGRNATALSSRAYDIVVKARKEGIQLPARLATLFPARVNHMARRRSRSDGSPRPGSTVSSHQHGDSSNHPPSALRRRASDRSQRPATPHPSAITSDDSTTDSETSTSDSDSDVRPVQLRGKGKGRADTPPNPRPPSVDRTKDMPDSARQSQVGSTSNRTKPTDPPSMARALALREKQAALSPFAAQAAKVSNRPPIGAGLPSRTQSAFPVRLAPQRVDNAMSAVGAPPNRETAAQPRADTAPLAVPSIQGPQIVHDVIQDVNRDRAQDEVADERRAPREKQDVVKVKEEREAVKVKEEQEAVKVEDDDSDVDQLAEDQPGASNEPMEGAAESIGDAAPDLKRGDGHSVATGDAESLDILRQDLQDIISQHCSQAHHVDDVPYIVMAQKLTQHVKLCSSFSWTEEEDRIALAESILCGVFASLDPGWSARRSAFVAARIWRDFRTDHSFDSYGEGKDKRSSRVSPADRSRRINHADDAMRDCLLSKVVEDGEVPYRWHPQECAAALIVQNTIPSATFFNKLSQAFAADKTVTRAGDILRFVTKLLDALDFQARSRNQIVEMKEIRSPVSRAKNALYPILNDMSTPVEVRHVLHVRSVQ